MIQCGTAEWHVDEQPGGAMAISSTKWPGFRMEGLAPVLQINGEDRKFQEYRIVPAAGDHRILEYTFPGAMTLTLSLSPCREGGVRLLATLRNTGDGEAILNHVTLLGAGPGTASVSFGPNRQAIRIMEQGNYWGRVRPLSALQGELVNQNQGEPNGSTASIQAASDLVWLVYDPIAPMGFLAGFLTSERWLGRMEMALSPTGDVSRWRMGFDGADVLLKPHHDVDLEEAVFLVGEDPWRLMESYADMVRERHHPVIPDRPPVSWCSWYPYRLGVTEGRVLENAQIAAERLKPLGCRIMQVDLGWEEGNLPSSFRENDRFPHGLQWLSDELQKLGFDLGVWKAPFTISEYDPLTREHPEYLIQGADGKPAPYWEWFWEPHGKVFILDLTHPGARQWLKDRIVSLADRGVRYLKADFIGCASHPLARRRYDPTIAAGGGTEAARLGARIIREALPDALLLNCGGPEMPGTGHWPLLYSCNDTGNTGFISHRAQKDNYQSLACHLFKNGRWGFLQPSCLCVGAPGTAEDARLRATIAFLTGGQIDISDTLTTLPEDRWSILTATLPPLGLTAKPVDLFEPLRAIPFDYEGTCQGEKAAEQAWKEFPPGSVWAVHVVTGWDEWDLVGVFCYGEGSSAEKPEIARFSIPFATLGISACEPRWGYEFWSGQFLGEVPGKRINPGGYAHPGDDQDLTVGNTPGVLDIAFFGPGVRLLGLRKARPHPWVVGTSFHQSCGMELERVTWDSASGVLSGDVCRPRGESGWMVIATAGMIPLSQQVNGRTVFARRGAHQSLILPMASIGAPTSWSVRFARPAVPGAPDAPSGSH